MFSRRELLEDLAETTRNPAPRPEWGGFSVTSAAGAGAHKRRKCPCGANTNGTYRCGVCRQRLNKKRRGERKRAKKAQHALRQEAIRYTIAFNRALRRPGMRATIEELVKALENATNELKAAEQSEADAKKAHEAATQVTDLARRARLNAEQAIKEAIRFRVGGPGEIL